MDTRKALTLRGEAGALVKQARAILEKAEVEKRDLNAEEHARFDALHREAETKVEFARSLERQASADAGFTTPMSGPTTEGARVDNGDAGAYVGPQADQDIGSTSLPHVSQDGWEPLRSNSPVFDLRTKFADRVNHDLPDGIKPRELSWGRVMRGLCLGDWRHAEGERRAMGEGSGAGGGFLVPSSLSARVVDLARNNAACLKAGALTMPMTTAEVTVARLAQDPTAFWTAESSAITESGLLFEPVKLRAQTLGVLVRISKELLEDAQILSETVEAAMGQVIGLEVDRVGLLGSGAGEPRGLWNTPGVQVYSMGVNGAAFAADGTGFSPFSHAVELIANANGEAQAVIFSPRTAGQADRLMNGLGDPLLQPDSYKGLDKFVSKQIGDAMTHGSATTASAAFVGAFDQLVFGFRTRLELEASRQAGTAFAQKEILVRALVRLDVGVFRPNHFAVIRGIIPPS